MYSTLFILFVRPIQNQWIQAVQFAFVIIPSWNKNGVVC